jgi:ketosteroid isomerase-like protein
MDLFRTITASIVTVCILVVVPASGQPASHEEAISTAYREWVDATNAKDIERWASFLAPDALFLPPNNPALTDEKAITDFYAELFTDERFFLECQQERVEISASEDLAWSTGHCKATFTGLDGEVAHDRSKWAKVWKRLPTGHWKCTVNSWSSTRAK